MAGTIPTAHVTRIMAFTSGKGGVGKTNVVANVAYRLTRMNKRVLVVDADLGLGNMDVLLGKAPRYNLSHVIAGEQPVEAVTFTGPGGMTVLPASSGIQDVTDLSPSQRGRLIAALDTLMDNVDYLLIDTAAGISANVMWFNLSAQNIFVLVTPEPTSITDAYALMKVMSKKYGEHAFNILVNMAHRESEAEDVFRQLDLVAQRFLDVTLRYAGCVLSDPSVPKSVKRQRMVCDAWPQATASQCIDTIARALMKMPAPDLPAGYTNRFWKDLVGQKFNRPKTARVEQC